VLVAIAFQCVTAFADGAAELPPASTVAARAGAVPSEPMSRTTAVLSRMAKDECLMQKLHVSGQMLSV